MTPKDITAEEWREYDFGNRTYHIADPVELYIGNTCHRVVDAAGVVHCCPAPGFMGCVLRWKNKPGKPPVQF